MYTHMIFNLINIHMLFIKHALLTMDLQTIKKFEKNSEELANSVWLAKQIKNNENTDYLNTEKEDNR